MTTNREMPSASEQAEELLAGKVNYGLLPSSIKDIIRALCDENEKQKESIRQMVEKAAADYLPAYREQGAKIFGLETERGELKAKLEAADEVAGQFTLVIDRIKNEQRLGYLSHPAWIRFSELGEESLAKYKETRE